MTANDTLGANPHFGSDAKASAPTHSTAFTASHKNTGDKRKRYDPSINVSPRGIYVVTLLYENEAL